MKRLPGLLLQILLSANSLFAQDFVVSNPNFSSNPAIYPGGKLSVTFDLFVFESDYTFSSNPSSDHFATIKFTFTKLNAVSSHPTGDGAGLFNWKFSSKNIPGSKKEYYWIGTTKDILMQNSPGRRKYKIKFNEIPVTVAATQMETDIKVIGLFIDPLTGKVNSSGNNSSQIATYSKPKKCDPGLDFGDLSSKWPLTIAKVISADCNNDGIPDGPNSSVWAGVGVNTEIEQIFSTDADGDEFDDGLVISSGNIKVGERNIFTIILSTNSTVQIPAYFGLWFDWNNDGDFTNDYSGVKYSSEGFYSGSGMASYNGTNINVPVLFPSNVSPVFKVRLVISDKTVDKNDLKNTIPNGEVEDYQIINPNQLITFSNFTAKAENCLIKINWNPFNEEDISAYEIEVSKNGIEYKTLAKINATNLLNYKYTVNLLDQVKALSVFVRIRTINKNGTYSYSEVINVTGLCPSATSWDITLYPNPAVNVNDVIIKVNQGLLDGKYKILLQDNRGRMLQSSEISLNKVSQFKYHLPFIANGNYRIIITNANNSQKAILEFLKL